MNMNVAARTGIAIELRAPSRHHVNWREFGYDVHRIERAVIESCVPEPASMVPLLRQRSGLANPSLLILECDASTAGGVADTSNWDAVLHRPLANCFTAIRGLVPWISSATHAPHIIALLSREALFPSATHGAAAVLARALTGLLEGLRAELRHGSTRVTLCVTDPDESSESFSARLADALERRPLYSLPPSVRSERIAAYFAPMIESLANTPRGEPMPAGPQGEVYREASSSPLENSPR